MPRWPSSSPAPADRDATPDHQGAAVTALPPDAGPILLALARGALAEALGAPAPEPPAGRTGSWLDEPGACFVTLTRNGRLRGCIGSVEPVRPLGVDVAANAVAAALSDHRFPPLDRAELDDTAIEVSVLGALVPFPVADEAEARRALRPGLDGLVLRLGERRATFLPQVWHTVPEPAAFLAHLKAKAGLPATYWSEQIRLSRYTVTEFHEER